MNLDNPLKIFSEDQLMGLDFKKLKALKKEVLLEFQFTQDATINLNGIEIDKNGVLEIFEELSHKLPLHVFIHENKNLHSFLYKRDTSIFNDSTLIARIKNFPDHSLELEQKIADRLKPLISEIVLDNGSHSKELTKIHEFILQLNPNLQYEVYTPAYQEFKNHLDFLEETYKTPFASASVKHFHRDLSNYVKLELYKKLAILPALFDPLKNRYCQWCNNDIVYAALKVEKRLSAYSRESLLVLRDAAKIASTHFNKENNLKIANSIQSHLRGSSNSNNSPSAWRVLFVIILLIKFLFWMGKCSDNSRGNRYTNSYRYNQNSTSLNSTDESYDKIIRQLRNQKRYKSPPKEKSVLLDFAGEKKKSLGAILTRTKEFSTHTELTYNVNVLPNRNTYLNQLVPKEVMDKHRGKLWPVTLKFKIPKIKNSNVEHRIKLDLKNEKRIAPQQYQHKKPEGSENLYLSLKKIPITDFPLRGKIERLNPTNEEVLDDVHFTINVMTSGVYQVRILDTGEKINIPKTYLKNLDSTTVADNKLRYASLLKNLTIINRKYLKQGNLYSLDKVYAYSFLPSNKVDDSIEKSILDKGNIKFGFVSEEDNTAYVGLRSKKANIKYYADFSTGILKGMSMITTSEKNTEIERITLFSSS